MRYHPCSSCSRHVRVTETACPFCGVARLARVAVLVAGVAALSACGGGDEKSGDAGSIMPLYGIPIVDGGPRDASADGGVEDDLDASLSPDVRVKDAGGGAQLYGQPP